MSRLVRHSSDEDESNIDLTPMLDVVFIMLIFFIVTASFVKESGYQMTRPDNANAENESDQKNIVLQVTATNEIWLNERRIDIRSVRANIERLHSENPKASLIIQSHPKAKNDTLAKISDQSREAKVADISLIISQDK